MLVGVVAGNCSTETTGSGVGELAISEMTREPVTPTCSTCPAGAAACAHAPCEHTRAKPATPPHKAALLNPIVMISPRDRMNCGAPSDGPLWVETRGYSKTL